MTQTTSQPPKEPHPNQASNAGADWDLVDSIRLGGILAFFFAAAILWCVELGVLGTAAAVTGVFLAVHLIISQVSWRRRASPLADTENDDDVRAKAKVLGQELNAHLVDENTASRDIAKQYVTVAGVALGLVASIASSPGVELFVGASSLAVAIGFGLILLERLSGTPRSRFWRFSVSILYHLMSWALLFGVMSLVGSLRHS